jgi:hypothetical protein
MDDEMVLVAIKKAWMGTTTGIHTNIAEAYNRKKAIALLGRKGLEAKSAAQLLADFSAKHPGILFIDVRPVF